jgi:hypothetical protein
MNEWITHRLDGEDLVHVAAEHRAGTGAGTRR